MNEFKRGDHVQYTINFDKFLLYNAVIIDDIYIKNKGFFYEVLYQQIIKQDKSNIENNTNFAKTWYIYKNLDGIKIALPFIKRNRKWINLKNNLSYCSAYFFEVDRLMKKYNFII